MVIYLLTNNLCKIPRVSKGIRISNLYFFLPSFSLSFCISSFSSALTRVLSRPSLILSKLILNSLNPSKLPGSCYWNAN